MTLLRISLGTSRVSEGYDQHAYTLWHRDRVHRIYGPRLRGTVGYRRMGRSVGSIGSMSIVLILGFVHLCQYVEEQAGQVLEDLEPTTHETHLRQGNSR